MSEPEAKKTKPSAGTKVTFKVAGYVAGMESDAAFEGVSFQKAIPPEMKGDVKATNTLRQGLMAEVCKKYGVKPLGAASAPAGGIGARDKELIKAIGSLTSDVKKIIAAFKKAKGKDVTEAEVQEILAA